MNPAALGNGAPHTRRAVLAAGVEGSEIERAAREYVRRGWFPVPIAAAGTKACREPGWQRLRIATEAQIVEYFAGAGGIGLRCGIDGLHDVDCDHALAVKLWQLFGIATGMVHGRPSAPSSHYWYVTADGSALSTTRYVDPSGLCLIELRGDRAQTLVAPSVHPSGERYRFETRDAPACVDPPRLQRRVALVATATMIALRWPTRSGQRHELALALAGTLQLGGLTPDDAVDLVGAIATAVGDEEVEDRRAAVRSTTAAIAAGDTVTAAPRLIEILGGDGPAVLSRARQWLGLADTVRVGAPETAARLVLRVCTVAELAELDLPPREMILDPIFPAQGLMMLYGERGIGKTFLTIAVAVGLGCGIGIIGWQAPRPRRVLYIDGEMPACLMRERLDQIVRGFDLTHAPASLQLLTPDVQSAGMPDLATASGRAALEPCLDGVEVIVLDSLSTLTTLKESEGDEWVLLQRWLLDQRRAGRSVILVHHAGKNGNQRGTSRREDVLDTVIALRRPRGYSPEQGARVALSIEKGRQLFGDAAKPIRAQLVAGPRGGLVWTRETTRVDLTAQVAALAATGLSQQAIAARLGIGQATVSRHLKLAGANGSGP